MTVAVPDVGMRSVVSTLMVVVLPAPFGPRIPKSSPSPTSNYRPSRATISFVCRRSVPVVVRKRRRTSRSSIAPTESRSISFGARGFGRLGLAHRLEERSHVAVEDVLLDQRLFGQGRDALTDGVLICRKLDLVVDADRDRVGLVAPRDGRRLLRDDLLRVGRVLHLSVVALVLELVETRALLGKIRALVPLLRVEVVVRGARLQHVDERRALVLDRLHDDRREVLGLERVAARDERVARGDRHGDGVNAVLDRLLGHGLRLLALREGG